jgi:hypothetical protein
MKLSPENIERIVFYALPERVTEEQRKVILSGRDLPGFVKGEGVRGRFLFDKKKLEEKRADVVDMLKELPDQFRNSGGGGWSFLNACTNKDGEQWGEHRNIDELVCLGRALGVLDFVLPREAWAMFPGGMPYFVVDVA